MFRFLFKKKPKQTAFCYCPNCKNELISSNSFIGEDENHLYDAKCSNCGNKSKWLLDTPVPILM
jgi:transcription elongation factor Elf1